MFSRFNISKKTGISIVICLVAIWGSAFALIHHFDKINSHKEAHRYSNFKDIHSRKKPMNNRNAVSNNLSKDKLQDTVKPLVTNGTITQDQANKVIESITSHTKEFTGKKPGENRAKAKSNLRE